MINDSKSVKKNYIYNVLYQILLIIIPLVVTPYISRVLGAEGIGKYSFSFSLITYFSIFASLGFANYAQREIARNNNNRYNQSIIFWEIFICRLIPMCFSLGLNFMLCFFKVYGDYNNLMTIFSIYIFSTAFDIAFFYQGNEKFGIIVLLSGIIKVIMMALIFIFVRSSEDLWKYTLINSISYLLGFLVLWVPLKRCIVKVKIKNMHPLRHMKGTLLLFIPTIATSIYTVLDRTLIGIMIEDTYIVIENGIEVTKKISDLENGYYEQSEKLVKMAMTVITCIGTVMIPRNTKEYSEGNYEVVKNNIYKSSRFVWMLSLPMIAGLVVVSNNFVSWFYGDEFEKCSTLIKVMSPLILIIGFSNVIGVQYLLPAKKDSLFAISLVIGAFMNLLLNILLISKMWSLGAAIASIAAELLVTGFMFFVVRREISIVKVISLSGKYLISSLIMFAVIWYPSKFLQPSILNTAIIVLVGICIYLICLLILKEEYCYYFIKKIFKKSDSKS